MSSTRTDIINIILPCLYSRVPSVSGVSAKCDIRSLFWDDWTRTRSASFSVFIHVMSYCYRLILSFGLSFTSCRQLGFAWLFRLNLPIEALAGDTPTFSVPRLPHPLGIPPIRGNAIREQGSVAVSPPCYHHANRFWIEFTVNAHVPSFSTSPHHWLCHRYLQTTSIHTTSRVYFPFLQQRQPVQPPSLFIDWIVLVDYPAAQCQSNSRRNTDAMLPRHWSYLTTL